MLFAVFLDAGELWNCAGSSLHALALKPRTEVSHSSSPMISPGSSPRFVRRNPPGTIIVPTAVPPPLPPRKSSPTQELPPIPTTSSSQAFRNGSPNIHAGLSETQSQSVTNLTSHQPVEVQLPKSSSMLEMRHSESGGGGPVELSTPETIVGLVVSNCDNNVIDTSKTPPRHLSCPSNRTARKPAPPKSHTTPNISSSKPYENIEVELRHLKNKKLANPLEREASVPYENININYIKKLVSEGYSRDSVIRALGITGNNVDMACDILHEFGTKLG
ncbi:hypothetical protein HUJ05_005045 [Dendroctonus ponderosae]|nr:hypothetical protein HUJ05_005045 [Dendroctonus ponderosae]